MARHICIAIIVLMFGCSGAWASDVTAGMAASQAKCSQCHDAGDWEGESVASLESLISGIVAGKVKHKNKLELSEKEIVNIAAYWGQAKRS